MKTMFVASILSAVLLTFSLVHADDGKNEAPQIKYVPVDERTADDLVRKLNNSSEACFYASEEFIATEGKYIDRFSEYVDPLFLTDKEINALYCVPQKKKKCADQFHIVKRNIQSDFLKYAKVYANYLKNTHGLELNGVFSCHATAEEVASMIKTIRTQRQYLLDNFRRSFVDRYRKLIETKLESEKPVQPVQIKVETGSHNPSSSVKK